MEINKRIHSNKVFQYLKITIFLFNYLKKLALFKMMMIKLKNLIWIVINLLKMDKSIRITKLYKIFTPQTLLKNRKPNRTLKMKIIITIITIIKLMDQEIKTPILSMVFNLVIILSSSSFLKRHTRLKAIRKYISPFKPLKESGNVI